MTDMQAVLVKSDLPTELQVLPSSNYSTNAQTRRRLEQVESRANRLLGSLSVTDLFQSMLFKSLFETESPGLQFHCCKPTGCG